MSPDGSVAAGYSRNGNGDPIAVYWRTDGVAHSIPDELAAAGLDVGKGRLMDVYAVQTSLDFIGWGRKDEIAHAMAWHARLP